MWETSQRGRRLVDKLVERARREAGLRPDVTALDVQWLIELLSRQGPGHGTSEVRNVRDRLLAITLDGLRARPAKPLPGSPPTQAHYGGRWRRRP
jgi:hypothetical protein